MTYQPTWESVSTHALPKWYDDAKLGIFVHWGVYSVPAWAPTGYSAMEVMRGNVDPKKFASDVPDGAFYFNNLEIPDSQTRAYHDKTYGANFAYDDFVPQFNQQLALWQPDDMATLFKQAGARYVVLTTKHHEGFLMWHAQTRNPFKPQFMAQRDVLDELSRAVRAENVRFGVYYSGGLDWTFNPGPIRDLADTSRTMPQSQQYADYVTAQFRELIARYEPAVLWNDIGMPVKADLPALFAEYYNRVPDGVVDERYGQFDLGALKSVIAIPPFNRWFDKLAQSEFHDGAPPTTSKHSDFITPEYAEFKTTVAKKWEATRGIGHSFGYNRNESDADYMTLPELTHFFVDIVSKNGNLLLNVGPMADGTIPTIQRARLQGLGEWLNVNGRAIFETRPWTQAEGVAHSAQGDTPMRFTKNGDAVFATLLGIPSATEISLSGVDARAVQNVKLLGQDAPLAWRIENDALVVTMPNELPASCVAAEACCVEII
jgi:alpha-L-fucosidase